MWKERRRRADWRERGAPSSAGHEAAEKAIAQDDSYDA